MPRPEALALALEAEVRLWAPEGAKALAWLTSTGPTPLGLGRCLSPDSIRSARRGWTPGARLVTRDGRPFTARGIVIPGRDGGRLSLLKVRPPDGSHPKYVEAFRDRPSLYPGPESIRPGRDLVVVEGEFEALVVGQALGGRAAVLTLVSASGRPTPDHLGPLLAAPRWWLATDDDPAGEKAAEGWPAPGRVGPGPRGPSRIGLRWRGPG